jgi:uncharacterized Zn-binding protein involved in type VI secretion
MAFAVARVTDRGSHGNVMLTGSPNVLCNGLPVHRLGDTFVCPQHGAGKTVLRCSSTVLVNGLQVAHLGSIGMDSAAAVIMGGSPDTVVGG